MLTDMLCSTCSPEYSQVKDMFTIYCCMCINMPPENFLMALFDLKTDQEESFGTACCSVFCTLLNIVYWELLQKNSPKHIKSLYTMVYINFLSKPEIYYANWFSKLPHCMTDNSECGALVLIGILIHLFCMLFFRGVDFVCNGYRSSIDVVDCHQFAYCQNNTVDSCFETEDESHIGEVQQFFGWAIKEGIDYWKEKDNKLLLTSENEIEAQTSDAYMFLTVVKSMHCFHNEILFDQEYVTDYYPVSIAAQNHRYLCLVAKPFFALGKQLLCKICTKNIATNDEW